MLSLRHSLAIFSTGLESVQFSNNSCRNLVQCGAKGPRPRYPRVWKTKKRIGTISKSLKLVESIKGLSNVKEEVYGALDSFIAWDLEFPLITVKKALKSLENEKEWKRVIQVTKWMLSKGQGRTMGSYYTLLNALAEDERLDEAEALWGTLFSENLESMPRIFFQRMISIYYRRDMHDKMFEVTRFKCGGFSIGFMTNHAILDGKSASEMFENLASACRGEGLKSQLIYNDRTCIRARNPPQIHYPHKEYVKLAKAVSLASSFTSQKRTSPSPLIFSDKYTHKLFCFSFEMLKLLKQKAILKCSTFEAIVAHIWRARTKAVFDEKNHDQDSTVLFAVDIRDKTTPPLRGSFAGNAVITAFATAKARDLIEKPFSFGVETVKNGRERVTDEYIRSAIDWLEVHKGIPATCHGSFYVSAWWKLPFKELDFGFGKPRHGGPIVSGNDEFVLLLSDENGVGINVWMGLEKEKMERFKSCVFEI